MSQDKSNNDIYEVVSFIKDRVVGIEEKLDAVSDRVTAIEGKLGGIDSRIDREGERNFQQDIRIAALEKK